jgi:flagellar assembly factor FliW
MQDNVVIETRRFGRIEVEQKDVIEFDTGLPGFPRARRFAIFDHADESLFAWLVSLDEPDLAFVVANPWNFFPDYDPPVDVRTLKQLGVTASEELEVIAIAILESGRVRLNLAAPLLINTRARRGLQLVPERTRYSTREDLPALAPATASGEGEGTRRRESPASSAYNAGGAK